MAAKLRTLVCKLPCRALRDMQMIVINMMLMMLLFVGLEGKIILSTLNYVQAQAFFVLTQNHQNIRSPGPEKLYPMNLRFLKLWWFHYYSFLERQLKSNLFRALKIKFDILNQIQLYFCKKQRSKGFFVTILRLPQGKPWGEEKVS